MPPTPNLREAAQARAAGTRAPADRPRGRCADADGSRPVARAQLERVSVREVRASDDAAAQLRFEGYAAVTEHGYDMWDWAGPYTEIVGRGAFGATLAAGPDVAFLLNHSGMTLARTASGTLQLSEDTTGLLVGADLDPENSAVRDLASAMRRGDIDQMSFAFRIDAGQWSPDYTEYRITAVDIDRGDVSAVNYGANPATSSQLRASQALEAIAAMDAGDVARASAVLDARRRELGLISRDGLAAAVALATRRP